MSHETMSRESTSLEQVQSQLASHIRNPDRQPGPAGIEDRRLKIYRDLVYQNIESFVSGGFPVLRSLFDDDAWHTMLRDFLVAHRCHSPYFLEIGQEFLLYLQQTREPGACDPPFMLELAHYEWVELGLDVADEDISALEYDRDGDLLAGMPLVSPLAWSLVYSYPVHRIGLDFRPAEPGEQPTYLVVYRDRDDRVGFMEINAVTARLLELLSGATVHSGRQALEQIAGELGHTDPGQIVEFGLGLLQQLHEVDIVLGTVPD